MDSECGGKSSPHSKSISYSYEYDDNGKMVLSDGEEVVDSFDYEEEANYSVSNSNVDINVPELKELKFCVNSEDGKIYSDTEVYVEASYDDKGSSGIQEIYLDYRSEDDEIECFDFYCEEEGEKTGSGTVKLTSEGRLAGKYELDYVYISDYAGNEYSWAVEYEDGIAVIDGVPVTELFGDELVTTYTVWPTEYKDVKIKHLYVSENAKSLSAGESFEITVVLQNDTDEVKRVYPEDWYIEWEAEEEDGTYYPEVYGSGDAIDIEAKSSKAFSFTMETSPYTHTGERILRKIEYNDNETGDVIIRYDYDAENGILVASDSWGSKIDLEPSLEYDGELDWNITKADKYDETPIILSGVEIKTKDIKAPGTVVFRVSLEDEGPAKLSEIYFDMVDINESRNYISLEPIEGGITKVSDKCYDVTVELYDDIIAGTYRFDYIYMQDEAEMGSHYYVEDVESDVVTDGEAIVEVPKMVIVESECKDTDFDGPILKDVLIPNEAEAGKSLCVKVSIEDESELSRAMIKLYNEERDYSFYVDSEKIEKNADGTYTVYFPIGKYMLSGDFELERIDLQDSSVHYNEETYRYDEEVNGWQPDSEDYDVLPFNKNRIVTIKKTVDVPVVENDGESLEKAIAEAKEGDTIVLIDIDGEENTRTLSKKDLLAAKDKKITLIISQPGEIGEVHIAAKDIPDNIPDKVYVSLEVDGIYYIGIEVEGFEELEDMFYEMYLRITADNVPFTLRIPVSEEYEGKEIKLVGFDDEGRNVNKLIYDNLEEKDGIVDVKFPNGSQDISYSYSDGTYVLLLTAKEGCAHKWETTWSHDENEHWYECEKDCGAKGESAVHEFGWIVDKEATETSTGLKHEECSVCHYKKDPVVIDKVVHVHVMKKTVEKAATCTEDGNQEYYTCTKCNKLFQDEAGTKQITAEETVIKSNGHSYEWILDKEATETETGLKHEECSVCHSKRNENTEIDKIDHVHEMKKTNEKAVTCTEDGNKEYYTCTKCNKLFLDEKGNLETSVEKVVIKAAGHKYEWIVDKEATQETTGLKHEECSVCHIKRSEGTVIDKLPGAGLGADDVYRIMGIDRYQTSFETANALKKQMGVDKFNTVVVTCGTNFADALAGSYLASVKKAPILMAKENAPATLADYIKDNMNSNGVIYILGGTNAVSSKVENAVKKANPNAGIIRLEGATRYETNLLILNEAGVTNQDILVCTGNGFADSLSASALERPILLVNKALSKEQKNYLDSLSGNKIYIIGGPNAVAEKVEKEMKAYGTTERIWGNTRYETSVEVAEKFFDKPSEAVIAYGENFPDGLSGGPLAMSKKAPLILASTRMGSIAADYTNKNSIRKGVVLGGPILISDDVIENIFKSDEVVLWK